MDIEQIREARLAKPFKPFSLVLDDGRLLPVEKPYFLGISPTRRFVVHSSEDGGFETIRPRQVQGIDLLDGNGHTAGADGARGPR